jgi:hypothetical protein
MQCIWHRDLHKILRQPRLKRPTRCFSSSSRWDASKPIQMEEFPCDVIRYEVYMYDVCEFRLPFLLPLRNFSIIAHIGSVVTISITHQPLTTHSKDHGKSTLADRCVEHKSPFISTLTQNPGCSKFVKYAFWKTFAEPPAFPQLTGTIQKKQAGKNEQVLDKLKVERERGITGKSKFFPRCCRG